ncbi:MAG: AraC family transcriptional regulator [Bacteroidota bacterium]|nr:AraC family transcriptional regulator [Bacteroidota bacterium]
MGSITALFVRTVLRVLDTERSTDAMLRSVGIRPDSEVDASRMIPAEEYYALLKRAAGVDAHPTTIPLRAGAAMRCEDYGAFGLAWKSASDLRGSYERAERYARVLTSVPTYEMEAVAGGTLMHLHREGRRRLGLRLSNEATIASIAAISREVSTEIFIPMAVYLKHQAPESIAEHEAYFGCPVHFSSDKDALLVSDAALRKPNRVGDAGISRFFESHLDEEVARIEDHEPQWVRWNAIRTCFAVLTSAHLIILVFSLGSGRHRRDNDIRVNRCVLLCGMLSTTENGWYPSSCSRFQWIQVLNANVRIRSASSRRRGRSRI